MSDEMDRFKLLAEKTGESLESICNLPLREREDLFKVFGMENDVEMVYETGVPVPSQYYFRKRTLRSTSTFTPNLKREKHEDDLFAFQSDSEDDFYTGSNRMKRASSPQRQQLVQGDQKLYKLLKTDLNLEEDEVHDQSITMEKSGEYKQIVDYVLEKLPTIKISDKARLESWFTPCSALKDTLRHAAGVEDCVKECIPQFIKEGSTAAGSFRRDILAFNEALGDAGELFFKAKGSHLSTKDRVQELISRPARWDPDGHWFEIQINEEDKASDSNGDKEDTWDRDRADSWGGYKEVARGGDKDIARGGDKDIAKGEVKIVGDSFSYRRKQDEEDEETDFETSDQLSDDDADWERLVKKKSNQGKGRGGKVGEGKGKGKSRGKSTDNFPPKGQKAPRGRARQNILDIWLRDPIPLGSGPSRARTPLTSSTRQRSSSSVGKILESREYQVAQTAHGSQEAKKADGSQEAQKAANGSQEAKKADGSPENDVPLPSDSPTVACPYCGKKYESKIVMSMHINMCKE